MKYLNLKARDYAINPEIIYKALILRARILEIPAHLDWKLQNEVGKKRISNIQSFAWNTFRIYVWIYFQAILLFYSIWIRLAYDITICILFGYLLTPIMCMSRFLKCKDYLILRFSEAVSIVFKQRPYSFIVGGISLIISLQFLSLGFLSFQNKRYFDESFNIKYKYFKKDS